MEKIEIVNENGHQFAYFKGVKLPSLIDSKIEDNLNEKPIAVLRFIVDLVKEPSALKQYNKTDPTNSIV